MLNLRLSLEENMHTDSVLRLWNPMIQHCKMSVMLVYWGKRHSVITAFSSNKFN